MTTHRPAHADRAFVGRRSEFQRFAGAVEAVIDGRGSVWLVAGDP